MKAGITGHQNLGEAESVAWVETILQEVITKYKVQYGFTSLAIGADQLFAEILFGLGISYTALLPCHDIEKTFHTLADMENYRRLLHTADKIEILDFIEPSEVAFFAAGKRVVDLSDLVIAVWNGQPAKGLGGTADAVKYARDRQKPVVHINPITQQVAVL